VRVSVLSGLFWVALVEVLVLAAVVELAVVAGLMVVLALALVVVEVTLLPLGLVILSLRMRHLRARSGRGTLTRAGFCSPQVGLLLQLRHVPM